MKVVKSKCENVWLFDVEKGDSFVKAGLACFMRGCDSTTTLVMANEEITVSLPFRAIGSAIPTRVVNARLPLQ